MQPLNWTIGTVHKNSTSCSQLSTKTVNYYKTVNKISLGTGLVSDFKLNVITELEFVI